MAAMAFRFPSVALKLGSWSNSTTFHLHRITREREALPSTAPTVLSNNINQLQPRPASYLDHESILPRRFTCPISDVGRCARHYEKHALFAVKEFNKQKDAQLQFVRWVRESQQLFCGCMNYFITLEAADAGTVKLYQAIVAQTISKELRLFGLVLDGGRLLKLIDNRRTSPKINRTRDPIDTRELYYPEVKVPVKTSRCSLEDEMLKTLHELPLQKYLSFGI
ncbi:hypothetical protein ACFX2H_019523 [Malus domestica]|uniref:uncharacterized protein n=1 Tax=Malus domestica TaxID=3750 RepID=UPI0010AB496E|nr:uncharacterized protein LOC103401977 isoform X1 [Malus domestica]XP_028950359.1 uncharacterized protein LOC103401977 isoform X1 [Malus domestica]